MSEIKKLYGQLPLSRELAIDYGVVEPTPEERADAERSCAEYEQRRAKPCATVETVAKTLGIETPS
jgi:hypothetical protein